MGSVPQFTARIQRRNGVGRVLCLDDEEVVSVLATFTSQIQLGTGQAARTDGDSVA